MDEKKNFHEVVQKDGMFFNREADDGYFYAGPLFIGLAFVGEELYCPTCGKKMERNTVYTQWFKCNSCKYTFNVLDKLPPDHPIFKNTEDGS